MAVTIYDIAREAKVGIGTVSRVFNDSPKVTIETRERVVRVAKRLNYQPHAFAQALARKRTNTFSAIIPFFTNYFFIQILQGVQESLISIGYDLIIHGTNSQEQLDEYFARSMRKGRVDGILLFSLGLPQRFADEFIQKDIPLILVDTFHPSFDSIRVNNVEGARTATEYLLSLGHSDIGMINANISSVPAKERLMSFKETLQQKNLSVRNDIVVSSMSGKQDGFNRDAGYYSMKEILSQKIKLPSAFFVSSDIQAIGVMDALAEKSIRVPEDIAIVSFDDIELANHFGLTTMRQPMFDMGIMAIEKLIERLKNPNVPPTLTTILPKLIVRKSCGGQQLDKPKLEHNFPLYSSEPQI